MMDNFTERYFPKVMDSTAVMTYKTCPRKFFFRIVLGFVPYTKYPYFAFGSAYHKFREILDKRWIEGERDKAKIFEEAITAASDYCKKHLVTPTEGKWKFMTQARLLASCIYAFKRWSEEKDEGVIEVIASEQPFRIVIPSKVVEDGIIIAGRADQIIKDRGKIWGRDFKTTSQAGGKDGGLSPFYTNTLEPNDQFTRYTYAESILQFGQLEDNPGRRVQGQYVEVLINNEKGGPNIENLITSRNKWQLEKWLEEHDVWMEFLFLSKERDAWPANEKSCNFCEYRKVCTMPSESSMMTELKGNYNVEPWDCENMHED